MTEHVRHIRLTAAIALMMATASAAAAPHDASRAVPAAFRHVPGARCATTRYGLTECTASDHEIRGDVNHCMADGGYFGRIFHASGVVLVDRFPAAGARPVAALHDRQFVCIGAEAGNGPGVAVWSYVIALPPRLIPDCRGTRLCRNGDFRVHWMGKPPAAPCRLDARGVYTQGCAAGWVLSDRVDAYSMGIKPVGD